MQMTDILAQMGGLQSMARELGVSESQAASGAEALIPAILGGFKRQTQAGADGGSGMDGLGGLLSQFGGGLLENVLSPQPTDVSQGNAVLGQIFGSKDVSRGVVHNAAAQSGLDEGLLKKMLPMLTMLVTGYMAQQANAGAGAQSAAAGGGLGGMLGGLLGSLGGTANASQGSGSGSGLSGLAAMLDQNGDGNVLDDVLRMAGKTLR